MHVFEKNSNIFNLLSDAVSEGILVINRDKIIVATNSRTDEMFGYEKNELKGSLLNILIPKSYHAEHENHINKYYKRKGRRRMAQGRNLFGVRKTGEEFPLEVGLNPFTLYDNTYVMALILDVTDRRLKEQEISHLAQILDESLNEIYVFDAQTLRFTNVNYGAQKNTGYSMAEFKELTPLDLKPEITATEFRKLLEPIANKNGKKVKFDTIHRRKDGTTYPVEVHMQSSIKGKENMVVAIILDITERLDYTQKLEIKVEERTKQLKNALVKERDLNELKTKFLSLVSHEFKTPLSGILTSATLVGKYTDAGQQEKRDKHLNTIKGEVRHLNNILNDFLSIERLETGKEIYRLTEFSLSKVVNEVIYNANMILKSGQKIDYPQNIDDVSIYQDEKIVTLALTNILYNALKYSPEDTEIELKVDLYADKVVFHVIDQGIGIPHDDQKHIFERYYRAENVLLTQGTGIGLNIVKGHLENLGGAIRFKSEENKGSTFTVEFPLKNTVKKKRDQKST